MPAPPASSARAAKDVLVVDDNVADTTLLRAVFRQLHVSHRLHVVEDGHRALSFLHKQGEYAHAPRPDVILLDLNLPKRSGREILNELKRHAALRTIPVMVFSSSASPSDIADSYERGANAYIVKPLQLHDLVALMRSIVEFWLTRAALPVEH